MKAIIIVGTVVLAVCLAWGAVLLAAVFAKGFKDLFGKGEKKDEDA